MQGFDTPLGTVVASDPQFCPFEFDCVVILRFIPHEKSLCGWGITKNLPKDRADNVTKNEALAFANEAITFLK
ncbi:hypothetical protein [Motilimonas cestriensis]|uniref:hypothetical protein n=1 Tax=Motilimonas cestriensis TaxID=2742685 RepID=UPI003DA442FD